MYIHPKKKASNDVLRLLLLYLIVFLIFALLSTLVFRLFFGAGLDAEIDKNTFTYEYSGIRSLLADSFEKALGELCVLLAILFSSLTVIPQHICACIIALRGFSSASVICKLITENAIRQNATVVFWIITSSIICACYGAVATHISKKTKTSAPLAAFFRTALLYPIFAGAVCALSAIKLYLLS